MKTEIIVEKLQLDCHIGVHEKERCARQPILVDITCELSTRPDDIAESIENTLNYKTIYLRVRQLAETQTFVLVETLAQTIAKLYFEDQHVISVRVRVVKPNKLPHCEAVGVIYSVERKTP